MTTHVKIVREWCVSLGILTAVSISRQEAEMKLAAYIPLLQREFPDAAFTADSLSHVAKASVKGFPTYGEVVGSLGDWWREHRPMPLALPPPDLPPPTWRDPPTPEELAYIQGRVVEVVGMLTSRAEEAALPTAPQARPLSPGLLDQLNPLPNGRKRVAA